MDRRNFLRLLLGGAAAAVAPTKAYSFLGSIFRGKTELVVPDGMIWMSNPTGPRPNIQAHLEAMSEAMLQSFLYGEPPRPWCGLEARYSVIDSGVKAGVEAGDWDNLVRIS